MHSKTSKPVASATVGFYITEVTYLLKQLGPLINSLPLLINIIIGIGASGPVIGRCPVSGRFSTANLTDLDLTYSVNSEFYENSQRLPTLGSLKIIGTSSCFGLTKKPFSGH